MKLSNALLALSVTASAGAVAIWGSSNPVALEELKVPGDNPLNYCATPETYMLDITAADLAPNPPQPGHNLTITARGILGEDIEAGAKAIVVVKLGLIKIINMEFDLCEQAGNVDLSCPVEKGPIEITKTVAIPHEVPPATYNVLADVVSKDGKKITCLTAKVLFKRGTIQMEQNFLANDL